MTIRLGPTGNVRCHVCTKLPLAAGTVWGQLRDFEQFASHDFFHARIGIDGRIPRQGARLSIDHRFFLFRASRIGRILKWNEGIGFAFSDLSRRGVRCGFPHVLEYRLDTLSDHAAVYIFNSAAAGPHRCHGGWQRCGCDGFSATYPDRSRIGCCNSRRSVGRR